MLLKLKTWYSLHKWLSVITGLVILMWLLTGLVMTAPGLLRIEYPEPESITAATAYDAILLAPTEAIARLDEILGRPAAVSAIDIKQVGDRLAYQLILGDGSVRLIDAETGSEISIGPDLAGQMARQAFSTDAGVARVEYLTRHDSGYFYGGVPAYRVVLADSAQTYVHVPVSGDEVTLNNRTARVIELFVAFHTFVILELLLPVQESFVIGMIWASSLITLLAALMGYYLALPRRWQVRQKRRSAA